jgi:hypothetical protein
MPSPRSSSRQRGCYLDLDHEGGTRTISLPSFGMEASAIPAPVPLAPTVCRTLFQPPPIFLDGFVLQQHEAGLDKAKTVPSTTHGSVKVTAESSSEP